MSAPVLPLSDIGDVQWRQVVRVRGRVKSMRVQPWEGVQSVEIVLYDETGGLVLVFTGRRRVPGIALGTEMEVVGRAGSRRGYLSILNPRYELLVAH